VDMCLIEIHLSSRAGCWQFRWSYNTEVTLR